MTQKSEKLAQKVKNYNKSNPSLSKKQERKLKRLGQKLRRIQKQQRATLTRQMDEELERQRIIREVEEETK